jgi:predicted GNAT superfamily acetyltransferase
MLGVLPAWRDAGIGRRLKLRQREEALERGIELIEWTFDPLELKNAFFNLERLGAIVRRYSENHYGVSDSPLHGGLPTDRSIAEWWLDSPRVRTVLAGEAVARNTEEAERIVFPSDMTRIRSEDPGRAREIQRTNGEKFQRAFERGMAVTGFERGETEGTYLLEPWP